MSKLNTAIAYDGEVIDVSDIPEITDFSKWHKNPERAKRLKSGYTIIVEHEGYNEVRKYDFTKIPKPSRGLPIPYEVTIEKTNVDISDTPPKDEIDVLDSINEGVLLKKLDIATSNLKRAFGK